MKAGRKHRNALGILGGAGPLIAAHIQMSFLVEYQKLTGVFQDWDFPAVYSINQAIDGVNSEGVFNPELAQACVAQRMETLARMGAGCIVIPCASLRPYTPEHEVVAIDWVGMMSEKLAQENTKTVGVVGSISSARDGIFKQALGEHGIEAVELDRARQALVSGLIEQGMRGMFRPQDKETVDQISNYLLERGAQRIWWGCTELSFLDRHWIGKRDILSNDAIIHASLKKII